MASPVALDEPSSPTLGHGGNAFDPFVSSAAGPEQLPRHRFSHFDSQLFALGPNASPAQAKRALEAHLAETDRRMDEAGRLGTALVQQRKELTERLKDVEKVQAEEELPDDLKHKLVDIEKEAEELAKESARASLAKPRIPSNEAAAGSPFVPDGARSGRRSVSPSKFEAQGTGSPTKLGVPNRKLRNQPANRVHDIEFAAEISTSLIGQVRSLQGLLAEKEEELRDLKYEKSRLENDTENLQQRVKTLDESDNRYKDETWSLETQVHELSNAQRDSAEREKKLQQAVNALQTEKTAAQQKMDELKLSHSKLVEEHTSAVKHHDVEMGAAKRNMAMADSDRVALQRKIEDLTGQNQELAKAISSQRGRTSDRQEILGMSDEEFDTANDNNTPEQSPPPSPVKGTPRHSMLETETLKTSLAHAQRMIQNLRTNIHREKTEKLEMRRMLQDARDEVEKMRGDPMANNKRARKTESREFKKPPRLLGNLRNARSEIFTDDANWEDHPESGSPNRTPSLHSPSQFETVVESAENDNFDTAHETSDQAFETANERGTESEFHTGAEEFSSEEAQTETESPSKRNTLKGRTPVLVPGLGRHGSIDSSASTEDEYDFDDLRTPTSQLPALQQKFPLRVSRGAFRRSRHVSEEPQFQSSPASAAQSSATGTPQQPIQSLAAELGDFDGSDNDSNLSATPSRRHLSRPGSIRGTTASPPPPVPSLPRPAMVDSGVMTDPIPEASPNLNVHAMNSDRPLSMNTVVSAATTDSAPHDLSENLARFPSPPTSPPKRGLAHDLEETHAAELDALRSEHAQEIERVHRENAGAQEAALLALKAGHAKELGALRTNHTDELSRNADGLRSAHATELDSIRAAHADHVARFDMEKNAAHAAVLDRLRAHHEEQLAATRKEKDESRVAALAALSSTHAAQIEVAKNELAEGHARELGALKANHTDQLEQLKQSLGEAHAEDLGKMKTASSAQMDDMKNGLTVDHARELEALKGAHATQLEQSSKGSETAKASAIAALIAAHTEQLESSKADSDAVLARELQTLRDGHLKQLEDTKSGHETTLAKELESLKNAHAEQLELSKSASRAAFENELADVRSSHDQELDKVKKESAAIHAAEIAALAAVHAKSLASSKTEGEATLAKELAVIKDTHAQDLDKLRSEHAAASAQELDSFKTALAKQVESSKSEGDAAHSQQIEAIHAANASIVEAHKRDAENAQTQALEALKATHDRQIEALTNEHALSKSKEIEDLVAGHDKALEALRNQHATSKSEELDDLAARHLGAIETVRHEHETAKAKQIEDIKTQHQAQLAAVVAEGAAMKTQELGELSASHIKEMELLRDEHKSALARLADELSAGHETKLSNLRIEVEATKARELETLTTSHAANIEAMRGEHNSARATDLENLKSDHALVLAAVQSDHQIALDDAVKSLKDGHAKELDALNSSHTTSKAEALHALSLDHAKRLDALRSESEATVARELEAAKVEHHKAMQHHLAQSMEEREKLLADHALALEALRKSPAASPPLLGLSALKAIETEPVENFEDIRSPKRDAFIIPRGSDVPETPSQRAIKKNSELIIAEDETRQSPSALRRGPETPESQRPFQEISANTDVRRAKKETVATTDQMAQTVLTGDEVHRMMRRARRQASQDSFMATPFDASADIVSVQRRRSTDSTGSVIRLRIKGGEAGIVAAPEPVPYRRPGSSASNRLQNLPPLPANHKEAIEAARSGSSNGGRGTMGPPLIPASAYVKNPSSRPRTPGGSSQVSVRGTPTPRANRANSAQGYADLHSPTRGPMRSRQSSVSSFASEIDNRFGIRADMAMEAAGLAGPGTDPRMIQAITQTMIGEYLWKYTRKAGRGEMSSTRHRRYFWVHPYTRTLYWSDRDPSSAGRAELKNKSVPIEAVRVVTDDNPMPPGLHRKSIVVISPGRTVKFTCTTGQRHETWFNALSYLLIRSGTEGESDAAEVAGHITQEDVDEFNPSITQRPTMGTRRAPPSLSSYNSRTTRNESPVVDYGIPTLSPNPAERPNITRSGTLGRLSGYWKSGTSNSTSGGIFSSLRGRSQSQSVAQNAIYEASEVHDSAEDLRQMIEQQDRESDRLENVRACCDGKHDVGTLHHHSRRGRHSHAHGQHTHNNQTGPSPAATPAGTLRSRA